ncbi:MAG: hypothetical protein QOF61_1247 [Acidobacteriota bacterium]|jgi:hypothetical protein|nr:hypothetical protein [Acidobacteriota bacterium]
MRSLHTEKVLLAALALAFFAGCQPQPGTTNATNVNMPNANASNTAGATNANDATASATAFQTREPNQYQATLVVTQAATNKGQAASVPNIRIARDGDNRRYSISGLPVVGEVIFLDRADKRYLVITGQKKYLELGAETTGFDVRSLTPAQMADRLKSQPGVVRVGDDTVNGRSVVKYRYAAAGHTSTAAGDVSGDSYIYVDKDTGLPIKFEGAAQSTGNVAGASQARLTAELRDLQTTVDPATFELPQGYAQVTKEEMKQYMQTLSTALQFLMQMSNGGAAQPMTTASPASSPSPAATQH